MNANYETTSGTAAAGNNKPLWAAVAILGVAVLAMGGALVYTQLRTVAPPPAVVAAAPAIVAETASTMAPTPAPVVEASSKQDDLVLAKPKPKPEKIYPTPSVVADAGTLASQPLAKPVCGNCGTIESATPVERQGKGSGTGAVAGGVLGAVVGNQIGHGGGRTAATVLGAIGGGFAGNAIEKNVRKETVYQVRVRMEDGSSRTVEQASMPAVGARVTVDNGVIHARGNGG